MITAGVDIGSVSTEVVVLGENKDILGFSVLASQVDVERTAREALDVALEEARLRREEIDYIIATGYGRNNVPFADKSVTEITCHALGAHHFFPGTRTIIDIGGQDSKAIAIVGQNNGGVRVFDFFIFEY